MKMKMNLKPNHANGQRILRRKTLEGLERDGYC